MYTESIAGTINPPVTHALLKAAGFCCKALLLTMPRTTQALQTRELKTDAKMIGSDLV